MNLSSVVACLSHPKLPTHPRRTDQSLMESHLDPDDATATFLSEAQKIVIEAERIADMLPNVDIPAVERAARQLYAIRTVLQQLDDPFITSEELEGMIRAVRELQVYLEESADRLASDPVLKPPKVHTGTPGRPAVDLDVEECIRLHDLGNSYASIARAFGVDRKTIYNHLARRGLTSARPSFSTITDDELDERIAEISLSHPFSGQRIILGHLEARGIHVSLQRVQESLRRVDEVGVLLRWRGIIKRRVYRVRGANALWHQDGNEKLLLWGFYVHGCIDGFSRQIIYLECTSNKRSATVEGIFLNAVKEFSWPSRVRGDFGKENNGIERQMRAHWGDAHRAYLRGRSTQNVRIERLWRDVRKDSLEAFRATFAHLEEEGSLDVNDPLHRAVLYLVYQPLIQASLDRTREAWNHHKIRTAGNRTPIAMYELSRRQAINGEYWHTNPGDNQSDADLPHYGVDPEAPTPPPPEAEEDPSEPDPNEDTAHQSASMQTDAELDVAADLLQDVNLEEDDGDWGMNAYRNAVRVLHARLRT